MPTAIKVLRGALLGLVAAVQIGWWLPSSTIDLSPITTKHPSPSERGGR